MSVASRRFRTCRDAAAREASIPSSRQIEGHLVVPSFREPGLDQQVIDGVQDGVRGPSWTTWWPGHCSASSAVIRSAIMTVGMWVLAEGMSGMTDASATERPSIPWTVPAVFTTEPEPGGPMVQVPTGW
jgi:hypothetical protein